MSRDLRKHHVQRDAELLGTMNMSEAGGVGNDGVCNKGSVSRVAVVRVPVADVGVRSFRPKAISGFEARSPATLEHFSDILTPPSDVSFAHSVEARHEAWILNHEGHEL